MIKVYCFDVSKDWNSTVSIQNRINDFKKQNEIDDSDIMFISHAISRDLQTSRIHIMITYKVPDE